MSSSSALDNPFQLGRALEPLARAYLTRAEALPGRNRGFALLSTRQNIELASKSRFSQLEELDEADPLSVPLKRWVHRLTEMRVNQLWLEEEQRLYRLQPTRVTEPEEGLFSLHDIKCRAFAHEGAQAEAWWHQLKLSGGALSAHRLEYLRRCREIHDRLALVDARRYWSPISSSEAIAPLVERSTGRLFAMQDETEAHSLFQLIQLGKATTLDAGWPTRLAPDSLRDLVGNREFLHGASPVLSSLPERLVPSSFYRAGYQLGRALHQAWCPIDRPFIFLRDPDGLAGHQLGALFVFWMMSSPFEQKVLGLSRAVSRARRRGVASTLLSWLMLAWTRATVFEKVLEGNFELESLGEQLHFLKLGSRSLRSLLALLDIRRDEAVRLAALLSAATRFSQLVEEYDEDFWLNPRAQQRIRAELSQSEQITVERADLQQGLTRLLSQIDEGLSA